MKSDILKVRQPSKSSFELPSTDSVQTIELMVSSASLQPFCSSLLGYTVPTVNVYMTISTTAILDVTDVSTQTAMATVTVTTGTATLADAEQRKREASADVSLVTPTALGAYSDDFLSSACAVAIPSPTPTLTSYFASTYATTATSVISVVTTTTSTQTAIAYPTQILMDGSFELNNGAWTFLRASEIASSVAYDMNDVLDLSLVNSYYSYAYQAVTIDLSLNYTLSYVYQINTLPPACAFYARIGNTGYTSLTGTRGSWIQGTQQLFASQSSTSLENIAIDFYISCQFDNNAEVYVDNVVLAVANPSITTSASSSAAPSSTVASTSNTFSTILSSSTIPSTSSSLPTTSSLSTVASTSTSSTSSSSTTSTAASCTPGTYTTPDGFQWVQECNTDRPGNDIGQTVTTSLEACIEACDAYGETCIGVVWVFSGQAQTYCDLKGGSLPAAVQPTSVGCDAAYRLYG